MNSLEYLKPPQLVTLLGEWPLSHPWVPVCVKSWKNIKGASNFTYVISDGSLEKLDDFQHKLDFPVRYSRKFVEKVEAALEKYPSLRAIRTKDLTWRKILDPVILFSDCPRIVLIDTDVLVRRPIVLPTQSGMFYLREDIPAYQGSAIVPWKFPMVRSFNAGFVLLEPAQVDLDFLEYVASEYLSGLKNFWWSEQLAWSLCAARTQKRFFWKGKDAAVLSGFLTRSALEIQSDVVKTFSSKKILSPEQLVEVAADASVLHLGSRIE